MDATLEAVKREGRGKNEANRLRASGKIPAVFYGPGKDGKAPEGVAVSVDPKAVLRILHSDSGANTLINLKVEGLEARVMVKEYQLDPVTHQLLHADFYQLAMDKAIVVTVPIVAEGRGQGRQAAGWHARFRDPRNRGAVPADRHSRAHRRRRQRADAARVDPRPRPGGRIPSGRRSATATRCSCTS